MVFTVFCLNQRLNTFMKPPICAICNKRFSGEGGLIYFEETDEDIAFNKRIKQAGFVGHPSNAFWFCENHIISASKYSEITKTEAFKILRNLEENIVINLKNKKID